ncbi:hypothetical protein [uncultured Aquimarina sp.]|uniref:hypothetical protein n=1 Tax=uncultured Aquimarina sp. TaxID=575652 RepID=UPI002603C2B2|nr:hypothetical protein [uncultured Aquimarina sp.]
MIKNVKHIIGITYLLLQLGLIISARFNSNRYFVWAPHDIQTEYFLEVYSFQKKLNDLKIKERYGLSSHGWIDLPANHLIKFITEYERIHPDSGTDSILLKYNVNGKNWSTWSYEE